MKISIITPLYNRIDLLRDTIESVMHQTYPHWEMIIVDDGSNDGSFGLARSFSYKTPKIKVYHRNREPKGAPTCRNIGIQKATGDFVMFLDSDDLTEPFCLEQRIKTAQNFPQYDFWVFQTLRFDKHGNRREWNNLKKNPVIQFLELDSPWHTSGSFWSKKTLLRNNLHFDEKLAVWQDIDFHLQALYKNLTFKDMLSSAPPDILYREHDASISQRAYPPHYRKSQLYFFDKWAKKLNSKEEQTALHNSFSTFINKIEHSENHKEITTVLTSTSSLIKPALRIKLLIRLTGLAIKKTKLRKIKK